MPGFVVEYHRPSGDWRVTSFLGPNGSEEALLRRFQLEEGDFGDEWEIASLNSNSLETVKKTHSRYFAGRELAPTIA
jgi:hypothetical protein